MMPPIRKHLVVNDDGEPVAVQIDIADWLEIERRLGLVSAQNAHAGPERVVDLNKYAGSLGPGVDPLKFQREARDEWPA